MCNRARNRGEPETLFEQFGAGAGWLNPKPMDNRFNPVELVPRGRAYVVREANSFSSSFLMPHADVLAEMPKVTSLRQIMDVACSRRGVHAAKSYKPLIMRASLMALWHSCRHEYGYRTIANLTRDVG